MTSAFQVTALPAANLDRVRRGVDDFGNACTVHIDRGDGVPLRCCLQEAKAGERVALIAYRPASRGGPYAEVGPVFIHADPCDGYQDHDAYPAGFRHRRQLFRAYDADGQQVHNQIVEGADAEQAIAGLFARPEIAYLHSRNLLAGCFMFAISRPDAAI